MKPMIVIFVAAALLTSITSERARADAVVELRLAGNDVRTVRANDFVTVAFEAVLTGDTAESFDMKIETDAGLSPVSILKTMTLTPNKLKKIPVTLAVSGDVIPGKTLKAALIVMRAGASEPASRAEAVFNIGRGPCALIEQLPENLIIAPGGTKDLDFSLKNCGGTEQEFKIDIRAEKGIFVQLPAPVRLPADSEYMFRITLRSRETSAPVSTLIFSAQASGLVLDEKTVGVRVISPAPEKKHSGYQYIPLVISVDHLLVSEQPAHTALKFSIPTFQENNVTLASDIWLDTKDSKLETRRRRFDMAAGRTAFSFGNIREIFSPMILGCGPDDRGWLLSHVMGKNTFILFSGGNGKGRRSSFKWRARAGRGLTFTTGYLDENYHDLNSSGRLRVQSFQSEWLAAPRLKINTELLHSAITPDDGTPRRNGTGFRATTLYQKSRLQIHTLYQDGGRDTAAASFQKGREFRVSYDAASHARMYAEVRRYALYSTPSITSALTVPRVTNSEAMGVSWPAAGGVLMFASLNHRRSEAPGAGGAPRTVDERCVLFQVTKQVRAMTVVLGVESGTRLDNNRRRQYRQYAFSGTYHHGGFTLNAGMNRTALFKDADLDTLNKSRISWNIGYTLPNNRLSLSLGRESGRGAGTYDFNGPTTRTVFSLDAMVQKDTKLQAEYEILSGGAYNNKTLTVNFSRLLNLKIPYKKNATLTGRAYADRNRNGIFDEGDELLPYIRVRLGGHTTMTDADGAYAVYDITPGAYDLTPDPASYPVGLSQSGTYPLHLNLGGGSNINEDIRLTPVSRISGRIRVDDGDFFARRAKLSPAKRRVLLQSGGRIAAETFSDAGGNYYFENVAQGKYTVSLDPDWLPGSVGIVGSASHDVSCDGMNSCPSPDFTIGMKKKEVIKTFGG